MLDASGEEIETSLGRLSKKQTFVRETLGLAWANKLDKMLYGGGGKQSIRWDLARLVGMSHEMYSQEDLAKEAQLIMQNILNLNIQLEELHDALLKIQPPAVQK